MEKLYHVIVKKENVFLGRYALKITDGFLIIKKAAGVNLFAKYLPKVIEALGDGFMEECKTLHKDRAYPWMIGYRIGSSGCYDIWVESLVDPEFVLINRSRYLHVSMRGKLNEEVLLDMQDIVPLLNSGELPLNEDDININVIDMTDFPISMFSVNS